MRIAPTLAVLAATLVVADIATAGPLGLGGGPKPGFEVFSVDAKGGGWIIHHMPGRGDTLWGCKDVSAVEECVQVYFNEWKTASKIKFIHVTDKSQKGWLVLTAPAMGDYLYACQDPEGAPACTLMEMELRPATASYDRVWPAYDCEFECGDKTTCGETLPDTDARRVIEAADKGDMLLQTGIMIPGPVNLYACKGLETAPVCELTIPNWLALDREDIGLGSLEDIETESSDGTVTYGPGVLIKKIDEESPAYAAGMREGDTILKVGPFEVSKATHARYMMLQYPAEQTLAFTMEDGKVIEIKINRKPKKSK